MEKIAQKIIFSGTVQGVGFRFTTLRAATRHNLTGYVRNLRDGTVEMLAQGSKDDVELCLKEVKGNLADYITNTNIQEIPLDKNISDFKIIF